MFTKTDDRIGLPNDHYLYVLLPLPSYIAGQIKSAFSKDQNIEIVNDPSKAQYDVYLNYAKQTADEKSGFVFYIHPIINGTFDRPADIFSKDHITVPSVSAKNANLISSALSTHAKKIARYKNNSEWLNTYPKR
jgi:hypothetical protein